MASMAREFRRDGKVRRTPRLGIPRSRPPAAQVSVEQAVESRWAATWRALFTPRRPSTTATTVLPEWKQLQRVRPVAQPGPARAPRRARARTAAELRARRLSTRSSRRRAERKRREAVQVDSRTAA